MGVVLPPVTGLYNPKAFIVHAASHCRTFVHCRCLSTAASLRSLGSISIPVWLTTLSGQLPIIALVSRYLTNKLIGLGAILKRHHETGAPLIFHTCERKMLCGIYVFRTCSPLKGRFPKRYSPVRHSTRDSEDSRSRSTCMPNPRRQRSF